jgi:hypothetical protein
MAGWPLCFAWCALGCAAAPQAASNLPAKAAVTAAAPAPGNAPPQRAPAALQKTFTGQPQPSLVVKNGFPIAQHLFIDWVQQALLAPASAHSFQLAPGTHTITCADSADPDDHPAAVTEAFDAGYAYVYELRPGG